MQPHDARLLEVFGILTRDVLWNLSTMCHKDPVASAVISNLCRSAPFFNISLDEVQRNRVESWEKEILASLAPDRPSVLDYSVWFSDDPSARKRPLGEHLPPAPHHNSVIADTLREWGESMRGHVFYPQIQTSKSVSRVTAAHYWTFILGAEEVHTDTTVTSAMLEKLYAESGVEIPGPCELRQVWGYNDLTPRTYFSQGGKTFHAAKYIREIANSLTNAFPQTHFISRFSLHDLPISREDTVIIYDYSSFTSNLAELKYFLDQLSAQVDDIEVLVVDSHEGVLRTTLGALIRQYNEAVNSRTEYTIQRYQEDDTTVLEHHLSGPLGVYGNIALSTLLHGMHARQLCGDHGDCKCVGDDVYGVYRIQGVMTQDTVFNAIEKLGTVQRTKVRWWTYRSIEEEGEDDHAWPYVKRPLDRLENHVSLDAAVFLPIFGLISPIPDILEREKETLDRRVKLLCVQSFAAIEQAKEIFPPLTEDQRKLLQGYLITLFKAVGLPVEGRLPFEAFVIGGRRFSGFLVPNLGEEFLSRSQWDLLQARWENRTSVVLRLPRMVTERLVQFERILSQDGQWVESTMDKRIAYLRGMDWAVAEPIYEMRYLEYDEYRRFYDALFAGDLIHLYQVRLIAGYPRWVQELVSL